MNTKNENKPTVPYIIHEAEMYRMERRLNRAHIALIISIIANVIVVVIEHFCK